MDVLILNRYYYYYYYYYYVPPFCRFRRRLKALTTGGRRCTRLE